MDQQSYDIAVVGAGAAGLTAAIFARRAAPEARIVALDGAPKIGAKILISGGGRCNVTHDVVTPDDFNGNRNAVARVLRTFTVEQTAAWFAEMGVTLKREETGKLFPTTDRARTVVDALLRACERVEIRTGTRVTAIECGAGFSPRFTIQTTRAEARATCVILATGGRSVPKTGSDGGGYALARALGHTVTETFPALVPLILEPGHWMTSLSGTSAEVELTVKGERGKVLARHRGSMLFTHFGISGPVTLDISRHWIAAKGELFVNFLPGETFESLDRQLTQVRGNLLRGRLPQRLLDVLLGEAKMHQLTKEERRRIVRALVETPVPVVRDRGFDYAEVTAGGVPLSEVDLSTMHSRKCDGLYLCGEILDVDGRIGGYNFQWAWASGKLAGEHAARSLHR
ncbi:MAG TPA: NAD(P)/FAD-dependent oxidoreductase [Thermoanaerobaculia bacterium]|nr:NAD(P)/FAD-dependent oxidoreductase [Thermoanaerobaculia bacterium]